MPTPSRLADAAPRGARFHPPVGRAEVPALVALLGFMLVILVGVGCSAIGYDAAELDPVFGTVVLLFLFGWAFEVLGAHPIGQFVKLISVFAALAVSTALASAVLATTARPLADASFVRADAWLFGGFDWPARMVAIQPHATVLLGLSRAYASLNWQPGLLLTCLLAFRGSRCAWQFLTAWGVALALCIAVFPWFPAVGGYAHFGIGPKMVPAVRVASAWNYPLLLEHLRDGTTSRLSTDTLQGIVAMPSFHAAAAVMLAWGFARTKLLRWPFAVLNLSMLVSTVPIGGHYIVDVVAGAATGWVAIVVGRRIDAAIHAAAPRNDIPQALPLTRLALLLPIKVRPRREAVAGAKADPLRRAA